MFEQQVAAKAMPQPLTPQRGTARPPPNAPTSLPPKADHTFHEVEPPPAALIREATPIRVKEKATGEDCATGSTPLGAGDTLRQLQTLI